MSVKCSQISKQIRNQRTAQTAKNIEPNSSYKLIEYIDDYSLKIKNRILYKMFETCKHVAFNMTHILFNLQKVLYIYIVELS